MDWLESQHRQNKRPFSESAQLEAVPQSSFIFDQSPPYSTEPTSPPPFFERQRAFFSNNSRPSPFGSPPAMDYPRSDQPPMFGQRRSQNVIDLTDDADAPATYQPTIRPSHIRPPSLIRSERPLSENVIDLTEDAEDDEVQIVGAQAINNQPVPALFPYSRSRHRHRPPGPRSIVAQRPGGGFLHIGDYAGGRLPPPQQEMLRTLQARMMQFHNYQHRHEPARMPGELQYGLHAFHQPEPPKPEHEPPPPARQGFTRSPKEDDVIVCPACDKELIVQNEDTAIRKARNRSRTIKDREEHPFWAVKECGHVYCNRCYQYRRPEKSTTTPLFPVSQTNKKTIACAVDDCGSEVGDKKAWVGIFL